MTKEHKESLRIIIVLLFINVLLQFTLVWCLLRINKTFNRQTQSISIIEEVLSGWELELYEENQDN